MDSLTLYSTAAIILAGGLYRATDAAAGIENAGAQTSRRSIAISSWRRVASRWDFPGTVGEKWNDSASLTFPVSLSLFLLLRIRQIRHHCRRYLNNSRPACHPHRRHLQIQQHIRPSGSSTQSLDAIPFSLVSLFRYSHRRHHCRFRPAPPSTLPSLPSPDLQISSHFLSLDLRHHHHRLSSDPISPPLGLQFSPSVSPVLSSRISPSPSSRSHSHLSLLRFLSLTRLDLTVCVSLSLQSRTDLSLWTSHCVSLSPSRSPSLSLSRLDGSAAIAAWLMLLFSSSSVVRLYHPLSRRRSRKNPTATPRASTRRWRWISSTSTWALASSTPTAPSVAQRISRGRRRVRWRRWSRK